MILIIKLPSAINTHVIRMARHVISQCSFKLKSSHFEKYPTNDLNSISNKTVVPKSLPIQSADIGKQNVDRGVALQSTTKNICLMLIIPVNMAGLTHQSNHLYKRR
ncbi:hypothetical protein J6590_060754 [Homalodisca vitripennis]|nr:hypothetical protein J6590_060754 [Homalodisca vitripennis]